MHQRGAIVGRKQHSNVNSCDLPRGWGEIDKLRPSFLLFGEMHGTMQSPAYVGSLVCALAKRGNRVLLALELPYSRNNNLQRGWLSSDTDLLAQNLKEEWKGRDDGYTSQALLSTLTSLHKSKSDGLPISVFQFDGFASKSEESKFLDLDGQARSEAAGAFNIYNAAFAGRYDYVIVLTGANHARKDLISFGGQSFKSVLGNLSNYGVALGFVMIPTGGNVWGCWLKPEVNIDRVKSVTQDMLMCGARPIKKVGAGKPKQDIALGISVNQPNVGKFDGYYSVGEVSASPPTSKSR